MTWKSTKDEGINKRDSENIYENNPGPTGPAKLVKSPWHHSKIFSLIPLSIVLFSTQTTVSNLS